MTTRDGIEAGTGLGVDARVLQDLAAGVISQEEAVAILTQRYGPERAQRMLQSAGGPAGSRMDQPQGGQMPPPGGAPPSQPRTQPGVPTAQPQQVRDPNRGILGTPIGRQGVTPAGTPEIEAGTGLPSGGPPQIGPGQGAADPSLMGQMGDFGFGADPQLRDIYPGLFESIQLGNFIDQTFPGAGGGFRRFLENQSGLLNAAYNLAGLTGGLTPGGPESTSDFGTFLSQLPRQGMNIGAVPGMDMLNQAANVLRGGTQGLGGGELDPNTGLPVGGSPGSDLQFQFLQEVAGNPLQQLMMALAPRMANLPGWARGAFFGAGRDAMNSILAQQGTNLGAGGLPQELLPILQQRGFNPFGG